MIPFTAPESTLGDIDARTAAALLGAAADVTLVVDRSGVILDLAVGSADLSREMDSQWLGQPWLDTVTVESRPKVDALLREAEVHGPGVWRHVNHPSRRGADLPIRYCAVRLPGPDHLVVLLGRNLQAVAALQQRLVEAQQSLERDYWRMRHVETRYRLLFQTSPDAILVLDAASHRVVEANPGAGRLLEATPAELTGRVFPTGLDPAGTRAVDTYLDRVRVSGRVEPVHARLSGSGRELRVSAQLLRQENTSLFLVRLSPVGGSGPALPDRQANLVDVIEGAPDAIVVTDPQGRVLRANAVFLELAQLASEEQARGQSLEQWLGRPGVDLDVLLANLRQHGAVRLFATSLRSEHGTPADVEISAAAVGREEPRALAFFVRSTGQRVGASQPLRHQLPRTVEQMTELVGRAPLKELVRESTDLIERLCIEAALELTGNNRASAAELLGLSRQSLYVKLRRYGLGENDAATDSPSG